MQLLGVAGLGPGFLAHPRDGGRVQPAEIAGFGRIQPTAAGDGAGAPLFQGGIVEKAVNLGIDDLRRQGRGLDQIPANHLDGSGFDAANDLGQPIQVHGFGQAVVESLVNQGMIRNFPVAGDVFEAGQLFGEHAGHQVLRLQAEQIGRRFLPALKAPERQGADRIPAPAHGEHGRGEQGLHQEIAQCRGVQVFDGVLQGEALRAAQGQDDRVLGRSGLQLEIEGPAEPLPERQSPAPIHPATVGRVNDELHAPGLVEKPLENQGIQGGQDAQGQLRRGEIIDGLLGGGGGNADVLFQESERGEKIQRSLSL